DPALIEDLKQDDEIAFGDLTDPESLEHAATGAAGIVHLASTFRDGDTDVAAADALARSWADGPFVYLSSTDVYGRPAAGPVHEALPLDESYSPYARGKILSERLLLAQAARRNRLDFTILRPPYVWGPHAYCRWQFRMGAAHAGYRAVHDGTPIV